MIVIVPKVIKKPAAKRKPKKNKNIEKKNSNNSKSKLFENSINLNKAKLKDLKKIKGIGESKALKIIEYREKHGRIYNIDELLEVKGIGDKLLIKIKRYCFVKFN